MPKESLLRRPLVRPVSQTLLTITDQDAFRRTISETVAWMNAPRRCNGQIPDNAFDGVPFDLGDQMESMPAAAAWLNDGSQKVWAAKLDFPDADVGQRKWSTEISVTQKGGVTLFLTRLTNITFGDDPAFSPSVPGVVRQVLSKLSVEIDNFPISEDAQNIDEAYVGDFINLLLSPNRRLPIVAVSEDDAGELPISPNVLIRRLAGAAHIVTIPRESAWKLTQVVGKRYSVFNGASRLYWPQLDLEADDPFRHPISFAHQQEDARGYAGWLAHRILPTAFVRPAIDFEKTRFSAIRAQSSALARASATGSDEIDELRNAASSLEASLHLLRQQREEDSEAAQALLDEASDKLEASQREANELASENQRLRAKLRAVALQRSGVTLNQDRRLTDYSDFENWADETLGESIEILPRAIRETEKRGAVELIGVLQDTLLTIRDFYLPMRQGGGLELREKFFERCRELNIEERACFAQADAIKAFPEYRAKYGTQWIWLERHFKYGNGYDLRRMFRIYFYWDEINQVVVIGHMPTHLDNMNTQ